MIQDAFKAKLSSYGQWTYRGAWALEVSAAILGLLTGVALGYQAFASAEAGSVSSMDLALASAPFFMVAIAELTKIPIATLLFSVTWRWKPIVFIFLCALAAITFETVFMGLERAVTLRQLRYDEIVKDLKKQRQEVETQTTILADTRADANALRKAQDAVNAVQQQAEQDHSRFLAQIAEVEKDMEGQRVLPPAAVRVRDAIAEKSRDRDKLFGERNAEIKERMDVFQRQQASYEQRIQDARRGNDPDAVRRYQDELGRLANPRPRIEQKYDGRLAALDAEIAQGKAEFDKIVAEAPPQSAADRQRLEGRRDEIRAQMDQADRDWEARKKEARQQVEVALANERDKGARLAAAQGRKTEASEEVARLEAKRIELARTDQVRRIAARVYGLQPETVSDDQAGFISVVWFGSLAGLAALAGPLTAIVALSLQKIAAADPQARDQDALGRTLRNVLLRWRWRRVRTVERPVEVAVEREVVRRVEVPVERVVKEILYVPIFTDDPEAVRRAMAETLPKDVADLVSTTMKKAHAGQAQHSAA